MRYLMRQRMFSLFIHARQRDRGILGTDESHQHHWEETPKKKVRHTQTVKPQTERVTCLGADAAFCCGVQCLLVNSVPSCPLTASLAQRQGRCFQHSPASPSIILPLSALSHTAHLSSTTSPVYWNWIQFKRNRKQTTDIEVSRSLCNYTTIGPVVDATITKNCPGCFE